MQSELENHLRGVEAPHVPDNLKARCLMTVPAFAQTSRTHPLPVYRVAATGALMLCMAVGIAFWSTRPIGKQTNAPSQSVAFAQTREAFQRVSFGHIQGRDMEAGILQKGWHASDFFQTEIWFDAARGLYRTREAALSNTQPAIVKETSWRALFLPNGTSYYGYAASKKVLVTSSPRHWDSYKKTFTNLLAGRWGDLSQTPSLSQWKGEQAQLFHGEVKTSPEDQKAMPGATRVQTFLYVNPATKLPLAFQEFVFYGDDIPRLTTELEFDFSRPDAARFDPAPLEKGAVISHGREVG